MPVAGTPIIVAHSEWLRAAGVRRVVLNLHHRPETHRRARGRRRAVGRRGALFVGARCSARRAVRAARLPLLDADRFFIVNGDTLTDCDLPAVAARHLDTGARVTMALVRGDVDRYGGVLVDDDGRVARLWQAVGRARARCTSSACRPSTPTSSRRLPDDRAQRNGADACIPQLIAAATRTPSRPSKASASFSTSARARDYLATVATVPHAKQRPFDVGADCRDRRRCAARAQRSSGIASPSAPARGCVNCIVADDVTIPAGTRLRRQRCWSDATGRGCAVASAL